jgi:hypothetical protein
LFKIIDYLSGALLGNLSIEDKALLTATTDTMMIVQDFYSSIFPFFEFPKALQSPFLVGLLNMTF